MAVEQGFLEHRHVLVADLDALGVAAQIELGEFRLDSPQPASVSILPFGSTTFVIAIGFE